VLALLLLLLVRPVLLLLVRLLLLLVAHGLASARPLPLRVAEHGHS
jgi:hypothetical protein